MNRTRLRDANCDTKKPQDQVSLLFQETRCAVERIYVLSSEISDPRTFLISIRNMQGPSTTHGKLIEAIQVSGEPRRLPD